MQISLFSSRHDIHGEILVRLEHFYGETLPRRQDALRQLIYMVIADRTAPSVGMAVFDRMISVYPNWARLRDATVNNLEQLFVGLPQKRRKAMMIPEILKAIEDITGELSLDHLADMPSEAAQRWLQALPGVNADVASAVLAFSSLDRPVFAISKQNIHPVRRLELCPPGTPMSAVSRIVTEAAPPQWTARQFAALSRGLGKLSENICTERQPDCARCPLATLCKSQGRSAEIIPFPSKKFKPSHTETVAQGS